MDVIRKDVIVVGLGAFGSAALWRLAERGVSTVGVERYGIGHNLGSSHGLTRLFRIACQEHPGLPVIARKSLELWTGLGEQAGEDLVFQTGCLSAGAPDSRPVKGTLAAAAAGGVPVTKISPRDLAARQPQYAGLSPVEVGVWDPGGGVCFPERNVRAHVEEARRHGAEIYPDTMALSIEGGPDGVTVLTPTAEFRAPRGGGCRWALAGSSYLASRSHRAGHRSTGSAPRTRCQMTSPWPGSPRSSGSAPTATTCGDMGRATVSGSR